jgi:hypothetical protein
MALGAIRDALPVEWAARSTAMHGYAAQEYIFQFNDNLSQAHITVRYCIFFFSGGWGLFRCVGARGAHLHPLHLHGGSRPPLRVGEIGVS